MDSFAYGIAIPLFSFLPYNFFLLLAPAYQICTIKLIPLLLGQHAPAHTMKTELLKRELANKWNAGVLVKKGRRIERLYYTHNIVDERRGVKEGNTPANTHSRR